jgi:hypothetical protein
MFCGYIENHPSIVRVYCASHQSVVLSSLRGTPECCLPNVPLLYYADSEIGGDEQMIFVSIALLSGIAAGFILRNKKKPPLIAGKISTLSIFILLFLLGLSIGKNSEVLGNLSAVGAQSAVLAAGGMLGSAVCSLFVYKYFFRTKSDEK